MANDLRKPGNNALSSIKIIIMAYLHSVHSIEKKGESNKIWHYMGGVKTLGKTCSIYILE